MSKYSLSRLITGHRFRLEAKCPDYAGNDACGNKDRCICRIMGEIYGYINYVIPQGYGEYGFGDISGKSKDNKDIWSPSLTTSICNSMAEYLYGTKDVSLLSNREDYNKASQLDQRFIDGSNLVIYNNMFKREVGLPVRNFQTGKTMLASIVLIDAIWRRLYQSNRADTYSFISYQTLKQDLKNKSDSIYDIKEADWLVIDDVSLPVNENDFNHQNMISLLDDFLMSRIESRLPTILCCDFDVKALDYSHILGYSFQKIMFSNNTWFVKVGE